MTLSFYRNISSIYSGEGLFIMISSPLLSTNVILLFNFIISTSILPDDCEVALLKSGIIQLWSFNLI